MQPQTSSPSSVDLLVVNWQDRLHPFAGGAEVHLHEMFGRLVQRGHTVTLLCAGWRGAPNRATIDGIEVHRVGTRATFALLARRYYSAHLGHLRFDVIVEDLNKAPLRVWRWGSTPTLLLVHHLFGSTAFDVANPLVAAPLWLMERRLGRLYPSGPVVAVSESTACDLQQHGIDADRITVIHNGVDTRYYRPCRSVRESAEPMIVYVGRLQRYKRVDLLVRAMAVLRTRGVRCRLVVAGTGQCAAELAYLAARLDLSKSVRLVGHVSRSTKRRMLRLAAVHAIASKKEGWGLTVLEAAACGVPTVATDAPGLRDAVMHERTGLLAEDTAESFADMLARLIVNPHLRARLGAEARRFAESFDWDSAASDMESYLARVAAKTLGRSSRVHLVQRPSHSIVPLPRLGDGVVAYGTSHYRIVTWGDERSTFRVTLGASDPGGRQPLLAFNDPPPQLRQILTSWRGGAIEQPGARVCWRLLGWPTKPVAWLTRQLTSLIEQSGADIDIHVADAATPTVARSRVLRTPVRDHEPGARSPDFHAGSPDADLS